MPTPGRVAWLERHQVSLYVGGILAGVLTGLAAGPSPAPAINPLPLVVAAMFG